MSAEKLYVVVREDLPPGSQAVQSIHAFRQFVKEFPDLEGTWFDMSNHLALLSVQDEDGLFRLISKALSKGLRYAGFHEPDLGNSLTAVAFEPGGRSKRLLRKLPLALSGSWP